MDEDYYTFNTRHLLTPDFRTCDGMSDQAVGENEEVRMLMRMICAPPHSRGR